MTTPPTCPPCEAALQALCEAERACVGNANARHAAGKIAIAALQDATNRITARMGVGADEVILNSGASEGNNTAIQGLCYASRRVGRHIVTTPLEHASVGGCLTALQERGYEIDVLPIGQDGRIRLDDLREALRPDTALVTLCAVDSELGVVQPVREAAEIVRAFPQCRLHVDATQAVGKVDFDFSLADTVAFSAHKFGGLTGSGALVKRRSVEMEPLIHGGVSATLYRSGTPAVGLAASLAAALDEALEAQPRRAEYVCALNARLRAELSRRCARIHSPENAVPHILNVGVDGVKGAAMRDALSARGVCVSVKSACSVENTPSRAVFAVTRNRRQAMESFRISLSHMTTEPEIDAFLMAFDAAREELTQK